MSKVFGLVSVLLVSGCGGKSASPTDVGGGEVADAGAPDGAVGGGEVADGSAVDAGVREKNGKETLCKDPTPILVDGKDTGFDRCASGDKLYSPVRHRRVAAACLHLGPASCTKGTCRADSECKGGAHCSPLTPTSTTCGCSYGCETDADCGGSSTICACFEGGGRCQRATCKTDSDCGPGLLCAEHAPTTCGADTGFACQTPQDECLVDNDCPSHSCNFDGTKRTCGPKPVCVTP